MFKKDGFTLIELLVVVLIIGILSSVALPQYQKAVLKARTTQLVTLVRSLKTAEEVYYLANGTYAVNFDELDIEMPAGGTVSGGNASYPNGYTYRLTTPTDPYSVYGSLPAPHRLTWMMYLDNMPTDKKGKTMCYSYDQNKITEQLCQSLGGTDPVNGCGGSCRIYSVL